MGGEKRRKVNGDEERMMTRDSGERLREMGVRIGVEGGRERVEKREGKGRREEARKRMAGSV